MSNRQIITKVAMVKVFN